MKKKQNRIPDSKGHFGTYGGRFVPETLMPALIELELAYNKCKKNKGFIKYPLMNGFIIQNSTVAIIAHINSLLRLLNGS